MEGRGCYPVSLVNHPWQNSGPPFNYCKLLNFCTVGGLDVDLWGPIRACSLLGHQQSLLTLSHIFSSSWKEASYFILLKSICYWHTLLWSPIQPWPHVSRWVLRPETLVRSNIEMTLFSLQLVSDLPGNLHHLFFFFFFSTHGLVAQRTGSLVAKQIPHQKTKCTTFILQVSPIYMRLSLCLLHRFSKGKACHLLKWEMGRWNGFFS